MRLPVETFSEIVVLTGAGVSVASGLGTYRGPGGLWTNDAAISLATAEAVQTEPEQVWRFFSDLRTSIGRARPNPAHLAIAAAERLMRPGASLTVLTQNVDGLHQATGSTNVVELHGSLWKTRCTSPACGYQREEDLTAVDPECPRCPDCSAWLRPDIVLFKEALSGEPEYFAKKSLRECDLFIAVGTSGTVSPASRFVRSGRVRRCTDRVRKRRATARRRSLLPGAADRPSGRAAPHATRRAGALSVWDGSRFLGCVRTSRVPRNREPSPAHALA